MRLVVADFLSNARLGEWHHTGVRWSVERDRPGTISGTIVDPTAATLVDRPLAVYVVYPDGTIPWSGIVWDLSPTAYGSNEWTFEGAGFTSILDFRIIRTDYRFQNTDQATMVSTILSDAATGTNGAIGWTVSTSATGRLRDLTIKATDRKSALKYLSDWCDNIDGFDFRAYADGNYVRKFDLQYPRDHRAEHVIRSRASIRITSWDDDWTFVANIIDGTGDDDLAYTQYGTPATNWPRLDREFRADSVSEAATLIQKVERYATLHNEPLYSAKVELINEPTGVAWLGEDIRLIDTDVSGRDEIFQLTAVEGSWAGGAPVETWTLEQQLRA
jgi:hypothetical protein